MTPIDFRNAAWHEIESRLTGLRRLAWENLIHHGPCTTRQLAFATGMDILTVRPRITELAQMGLARLVPEAGHGNEGVYEAVGIVEARMEHDGARAAMDARQLNLRLTA